MPGALEPFSDDGIRDRLLVEFLDFFKFAAEKSHGILTDKFLSGVRDSSKCKKISILKGNDLKDIGVYFDLVNEAPVLSKKRYLIIHIIRNSNVIFIINH